ncbi:MAG: peptidase S8 [Clostridiales bacterium]|nr:peptidase S8 [Clostridiales bacterium]
MKKIDKKLLNFAILSQKDCSLECIVYYSNKNKLLDYLKLNNIKILNDFDFIYAVAVCFNSDNMLKTASQNFVTYISSVSSAQALMDVSKKIIGLKDCNLTGKNVSIAFIDTGINSHFDFCLGKKRIIKFVDFINKIDCNYDDNGHGTFVAGVASGSGFLSCKKYAGIAPNSNIISLKALNSAGEANALTILEAMQWVYDNCKKYNIRVVCMSFGSEPLGYNDPIMKGAESLWESGITVVCAGGNSGPQNQTIKSPGVSKKILTVGGLDDKRSELGDYSWQNFDVAKFSSRGPAFGKIKPDILAPSMNICSCSYKGGYKQMSGTSVATPMVAGVCALIYERFPEARPEQIKRFLLTNAINIHKSKFEQGYGVLNFALKD